jgi:hypothetical protein
MKSKRIWAMMGVVYMCIIVLLMVYWMARMRFVEGITGIMLFPAFGGLSGQFFNRAWIIRHGRVGHVEEEDFQEPETPQPGWGKDFACGCLLLVVTLLLLLLGIGQLVSFFAAG